MTVRNATQCKTGGGCAQSAFSQMWTCKIGAQNGFFEKIRRKPPATPLLEAAERRRRVTIVRGTRCRPEKLAASPKEGV